MVLTTIEHCKHRKQYATPLKPPSALSAALAQIPAAGRGLPGGLLARAHALAGGGEVVARGHGAERQHRGAHGPGPR